MQTVEDATTPLEMGPGLALYRGLSTWEEAVLRRDRRIVLAARRPISGDVGLGTLLRPNRALDHVLNIRRALLSLTLQRATAVWYASHELHPDGTIHEKVGTLVTVVAPQRVEAEMHGDTSPAVWVGKPGAVLVDPRYVLALDSVDAWIEGRSRSRRDHEILLASGGLSPIKVERVTASDCTRGVVPWAVSGWSNPRFR